MTRGSPNSLSLATAGAGPFVHEGVFYADPAEYLAGTIPFIEAALSAGEPVLVAAPPANLELISSALYGGGGRSAARSRATAGGSSTVGGVRFVDLTVAGRNPGRIIPEVLYAFAAGHAGRRVSVIGEPIWPGRSPAEYRVAVRHESLINLAFAGWDAAIRCPYDMTGLDPAALADAGRTHPVLADHAGIKQPSGAYLEPAALLATLDGDLPEPPPTAAEMDFGAADLRSLRHFVWAHTAPPGLPADRVLDLVLAVSEVATNTVQHSAAGTGTLRLWRQDGGVTCEIRDSGHVADLLAGRLPASPASVHGRGLLIVNHLCDLVELHSSDGSTVVRMHISS
jgi:anti-sigma regulatory factor (Ser/Thr protein kinase)